MFSLPAPPEDDWPLEPLLLAPLEPLELSPEEPDVPLDWPLVPAAPLEPLAPLEAWPLAPLEAWPEVPED
ncbi:MAG: hypothetical protein U0270_09520 [Labilithrix sp.]